MTSMEFLRIRLVGARFEAGAVPLEVLKDLTLLQEMIIAVARWHYLQDHDERVRAPKGFTSAVSLNLHSLESSNTIIGLLLQFREGSYRTPTGDIPYRQYFEQARTSILNIVGAAENSVPAGTPFNQEHYAYFNRLGQCLQPYEQLELIPPGGLPGPKLNTDVRRRLSMQSRSARSFRQELSCYGFVPAANQNLKTSDLQLLDGRTVQGPISEEYWEPLLQAFINYQTDVRIAVRVSGIAITDWSNNILSLETIDSVTPLEPLDITVQLDQFNLLADGWFDGVGEAFDPVKLEWLANMLESRFLGLHPLPRLYSLAEGGVIAEWRIGDQDISLEIDLEEKTGYWHNLNHATDETEDRDLDLNNLEHLDWLRNQFPDPDRE